MEFERRRFRCFSRHENGHNRSVVARLVKILEVQPVIPDLIDRRTIKRFLADLKFDCEDHRPNHENGIDASAHPRNVELEEDGSREASELRAEKFDLREPRVRWVGIKAKSQFRASSPKTASSVASRNSAIEAPYQKRNEQLCRFVYCVNSTGVIIAVRRFDCAMREVRELVVRYPRPAR